MLILSRCSCHCHELRSLFHTVIIFTLSNYPRKIHQSSIHAKAGVQKRVFCFICSLRYFRGPRRIAWRSPIAEAIPIENRASDFYIWPGPTLFRV